MSSTASTAAEPQINHDSLIVQFKADCELRGLTKGTIERYVGAAKKLVRFVEASGLDLRDDRTVLKGFLDHLRRNNLLSRKTLEGDFTSISNFYEFLAYEGYVGANPVLPFRRRYITRYKDNDEGGERKLISVEEMARLINSEMNIRNKALITLLAKTGIRRNELISLDASDVDLIEMKIRLKPTAKRTNRTVFIDDETAFILRRWLRVREGVNLKGITALFINLESDRLNRRGVYEAVTNAAERVGLHDPESDGMDDHFSPHCCRHWFTTHLRRAGMRREFIQELRGDSRKEAIDIYDHIDLKELKEAYLACIPQLGI